MEIGPVNYVTKILIPSVNGFWNPPAIPYYSQPWEYLADLFGGVERIGYNHTPNAHQDALDYWAQIINN